MLRLDYNQIGPKGGQAIAQALERNQVRYMFSFLTSVTSLLYLLQTLTELDLGNNHIGEESEELLRKVLDKRRNLEMQFLSS